MKETMIFFGSGPVAARSLNYLREKFNFEAIITKPSTFDEMRTAAEDPVLKIYSINSSSELDDLINKKKFKSRLGVLIDFGIIISHKTIDSFQLGIVNSHFSLLPEWRGPDPISFAILSGQKTTGISLMLVNDKMDEGFLLTQEKLDITHKETGPSLTEKLINLSNQMLTSNLPEYVEGRLLPWPQAKSGISYSRKLTKADGVIDWSKPAEIIEREIRAYAGWPKSHTKLGKTEIIITEAHHAMAANHKPPGSFEIFDKETLRVYCGKDSLYIDRLKPVGKKEMTVDEFIRGYGTKINNLTI